MTTTFEVFREDWNPETPYSVRYFTPDIENDDGTQGRETVLPETYKTVAEASQAAFAILGIDPLIGGCELPGERPQSYADLIRFPD